MTEEQAKELLHKYRLGLCTPAEETAILNWFDEASATPHPEWTEEEKSVFFELLNKRLSAQTGLNLSALAEESAPVIPLEKAGTQKKSRWLWAAAAASIMAVLAAGAYFLLSNEHTAPQVAKAPANTDVAPGRNGAILTLADGTQVVLDQLGNGVVASQNGAEAVLKNKQLAYNVTGKASAEVEYNSISTPKGRQFQVTLPDGTQVWLNSASSIRYPTVFTGKARAVEITGEAYFEVAKDPGMPFRVNVNNKAEIEVLGTHFNVNAYDNETNINTTLLEGRVRVQAGRETPATAQPARILKPGQQALIAAAAPAITVVNNADIEKVMAWKNGLFNFEDVSLEDAMKQLERWYDIEVVYEKGIPDIYFVGKISKDVTLAGMLKLLRASQVHFRIEQNRRLIVSP